MIGLSKPPARTLSAIPKIGDAAPAGRVRQTVAGQSALVTFLRHVGCPFAEATILALNSLGCEEVVRLVVSHGDHDQTHRWLAAIGGGDRLQVVVDEQREEYARWGLGFTSAAHFLHPSVLSSVGKLLIRGIRNRRASGTRWQTAGTFVLDSNTIVRARHVPLRADDLPNTEALDKALGRA